MWETPFTPVMKPHLDVTSSLRLWGNQGREVVFGACWTRLSWWKYLGHAGLDETSMGVGMVRGFGWIIGNWMIPMSCLLLPPYFPIPGVPSMEAHPLGQGTMTMSTYPMGEHCYGAFEMKYGNNTQESKKMHLALVVVIPFRDFCFLSTILPSY